MFRFLRKYNKYILAFFGTILLVTFLVPFAITQLLPQGAPSRTKWATLGPDGDEKLNANDLDNARRELRLIDRLKALGQVVPLFSDLDSPEHWFLLVRAAESAGLVGGAAASPLARSEEGMAQLVQLTSENPRFILQTMAKLAGVSSIIDLYMGGTPYSQSIPSSRYSDRRFKHLAQERFHQVSARFVVIEATPPDEPLTYSDAQLREQMDKYAEQFPGEGEMGFGYRLPDRIKLEWLVVSADSVRAIVENSDDLNPVALRKHWRLNAARLGQPQPDADVPDAVRDDLLDTLTEQTLNEISRSGYNLLRRERRTLGFSGGSATLPDGWEGLSFTQLAQSLQESYGVALPEYHATGGDWLWENDLGDLEGIGLATTTKFGQLPIGLRALVMAAREFGGDDTIPVQRGLAGPPLEGFDGSLYFFRITDTDPSRIPRSIDEVRGAVIADLGRLDAYEDLSESKATIESQAREQGLLSVAMAYDTVVQPTRAFSGTSVTNLPKIGVNKQAIETLIERARSLPADRSIDDLSEEQRTFVLPVDDRLALLVVRLTSQRPMTETSYAQQAQNGILQFSITLPETQERRVEAIEAFGFDALAARYNFSLIVDTPTNQPDEDEPEQPSS